jgi:hypothetical protein
MDRDEILARALVGEAHAKLDRLDADGVDALRELISLAAKLLDRSATDEDRKAAETRLSDETRSRFLVET